MRMAITHQSSSSYGHEDYFDIELSSSQNFHGHSVSSPPQSSEFEFQQFPLADDKESPPTSSADELFYKGKVLPLHLPPRLLMVQKLVQSPTISAADSFDRKSDDSSAENYSVSSTSITPATTTTPSESSNISSSESCRMSNELNHDEYSFELSSELNSIVGYNKFARKSWSEKLKKFHLGQKLKATSSYLRNLFCKSGRAKATRDLESEAVSEEKDCFNTCKMVSKANPFPEIDNEILNLSSSVKKSMEKEMDTAPATGGGSHIHARRRSFSGVIRKQATDNSSSSISSSSSSSSFKISNGGLHGSVLIKKSITASSEIENLIEGAIAYCKSSQRQLYYSENATETDPGICSSYTSGIVAGQA